MAGWQAALAVVMGLGVAVILLGGFWDRERRLRAQRARSLPPDRNVPGLPADAAPPRYLDHDQALRTPEDAESLALDPVRRTALRARVAAATPVPAGLASTRFVTDPDTGWAVADDATVLVCSEPVESLRELLPTLERVLAGGTPLVIVAPGMRAEVLETLEANQAQRSLRLVVVRADHDPLYRLAELSGATALDHSDLQAGYAPGQAFGQVATWVSDRKQSWVLGTSPAT